MVKKKQTFMEILSEVPKPKPVSGDLPYVFDLFFDIKRADQIDSLLKDKDIHFFKRLLAENGYDSRQWEIDFYGKDR